MISIDYSLIIVILNFVLLLIILNKILYKPIKKFLSERQTKISQDIDDAKESKEVAANLVIQKEDELKTGSEEIRKMKHHAKLDATDQANEIVKSAKSQEKKIMQETEAQLENERIKVMEKVEEELSGMISDISAKFLTEKLDKEKDTDLIEKMLAEKGNK